MAGIDPARFTAWSRASHRDCKAFYDGMDLGRNVWCIAGVSTPAWAKKVFPGCSESEAVEKLWDAILYTARADGADPAAAWADHSAAFQARIKLLNEKQFDALRYTSSNGTDFTVGMNPGHIWAGGGAETVDGTWFFPNMPTEEIFTSPHRDRADGVVHSALPLNYRGGMIEDFWIGMMILVMRLNQEMPWISAASSISPESWSIALMPLLEAKGRYLTEPQRASSAKEP